ncbi:uncharacterized protein TM35_000014420 [Trypanosoma theileri]|uniref:Uncharacterized protein n=1 Tax=Trypanosoma theileri TaxID=67003 RepID=A0A1X0P9S1_9TRYP|nr:uncharacterized protein TM35_000014420 [Trypanosoma theileri]ORC93565.1 hypothetical protein TM35_000014420 [Trypanosoma theileri]
MYASEEKDLWDVTYILPNSHRRVVYRMVPLHNINDLIELTCEMAKTCKIRMQCNDLTPTAHVHTKYILPGFHLYHELPNNNNNNNDNIPHGESFLLQPNPASWHSFYQQQGNSKSVLLRIVPCELFTSPHVKRRKGELSLNRLGKKREDDNREISTEEKVGNPSLRVLHSTKVETPSTSSPKLDSHFSKFPPALIQLRRQINRDSSLQNKSPTHLYDGDTLVDVSLATVRIFALRYVLSQIHAFLNEQITASKNKEERIPLLTREGIVYFAAAVVKEWQMKLEFTTAAMNEVWNCIPPLVRNAQFEYLKNILFNIWTQFLEAKENQKKNQEEVKNKEKMKMMGIEKKQSSLHSVNEKNIKTKPSERIALIEEVTYCSSRGPLPLPSGNVEGKQLFLSLLNVNSQVDVKKEFSVTGQVLGVRNPLGLFWWIVESEWNSQTSNDKFQQGEENSVLLPLDVFYNESRLVTFQITSQTFLLIIQAGTLNASRSYRLIAEVCDIHTGEIAVDEVKFSTMG